MVNSIVLVGRASDPQVTYLASGEVKAVLRIAVDRPIVRTTDSETTETDWFRVEMVGKPAEIAERYVRKGALVGIQGRIEILRQRDVTGYQDIHVIRASNIRILGSKATPMPVTEIGA